MSTTPTEVLETVAATEAGFDFDAVKGIMDNFDPASLLPDLSSVFGWMELVCRVLVLVGPIIMAVLGLCYLFLAPKEANYYFGYRTYFGMGSVQAWRFTQRLAGIVFAALGLVSGIAVLLISGSFAGMDTMALLWKAVYCVLAEAGLVIVSCLTINTVVALRYDGKGYERKNKRKKR